MVSKLLGVVYLLVISQANERQGQTLNTGCAFSSCLRGKRHGPGSCQPPVREGSGQPELCHHAGFSEAVAEVQL